MATFSLSIPYPDGEGPRIMAALKWKATTNGNPNPTNAEAIEWLRQTAARDVKQAVLEYESWVATNSITDVNVG